jgi:hypothetical protein
MFIRSLAAFTDALGVENAPIIMHMAMIPWPSDEVRNDFIRDLTNISMKDIADYERN